MKNFISILITNYNKGKFLNKTLKSLEQQTFKNFEVIIYDDCSTDNSIEIIKKFRKFRLIQNTRKNMNPSPMNQIIGVIKCFKKSKGNLICLLDGDDFFLKYKLSEVDKFFKKNKKSNCLFDLPNINYNQFVLKNKKNIGTIWPSIIPTSCISFRVSFFNKFMKYVKINEYMHLEIDTRITIFSKFFYDEYNLLNKNLTIYNYDENGITAKINKLTRKWWYRRKESFLYLRFILKSKKKKFLKSFDYFLTMFINKIF